MRERLIMVEAAERRCDWNRYVSGSCSRRNWGCGKREWKNTCKMSMNMIEDY